MQSNGAEMMRLAASMAVEDGLMICAPIHDAFLLEAPIGEIEEHSARLAAIMVRASEIVLGNGRRCRVDQNIVRYPDRYMDEPRPRDVRDGHAAPGGGRAGGGGQALLAPTNRRLGVDPVETRCPRYRTLRIPYSLLVTPISEREISPMTRRALSNQEWAAQYRLPDTGLEATETKMATRRQKEATSRPFR